MHEKFDVREMKREIAEDEKLSKNKPILLTQLEIDELIKNRSPQLAGGNRHDDVR